MGEKVKVEEVGRARQHVCFDSEPSTDENQSVNACQCLSAPTTMSVNACAHSLQRRGGYALAQVETRRHFFPTRFPPLFTTTWFALHLQRFSNRPNPPNRDQILVALRNLVPKRQ